MDQDNSLLEEVSCENNILKENLENKKQELDILGMLSLRIRPYWKRSIIRIIYYNSSSNMLMKKLGG